MPHSDTADRANVSIKVFCYLTDWRVLLIRLSFALPGALRFFLAAAQLRAAKSGLRGLGARPVGPLETSGLRWQNYASPQLSRQGRAGKGQAAREGLERSEVCGGWGLSWSSPSCRTPDMTLQLSCLCGFLCFTKSEASQKATCLWSLEELVLVDLRSTEAGTPTHSHKD